MANGINGTIADPILNGSSNKLFKRMTSHPIWKTHPMWQVAAVSFTLKGLVKGSEEIKDINTIPNNSQYEVSFLITHRDFIPLIQTSGKVSHHKQIWIEESKYIWRSENLTPAITFNDGRGPVQQKGLFSLSHQDTDLGCCLKWDWQKLKNSNNKKMRQEKLDLLQKRKYKRKRQNPLTELDEESIVNGLSGVIEITLLITARKL